MTDPIDRFDALLEAMVTKPPYESAGEVPDGESDQSESDAEQ